MAREEHVLFLQGDGTDCALVGVAIDLDAAIVEEQDQPVPIFGDVFGDVFERVACGRFGGDLVAGALLAWRRPRRSSTDVPRACASIR